MADLLKPAPDTLNKFPKEWEPLRTKRNKFLHGKSFSFALTRDDAAKAVDSTPKAVAVFVWLNNTYCSRE